MSVTTADQAAPAALPQTAPLLAIRGLKVEYQSGTTAVGGVDLTLQAGEIVALVGESGSGKTTLARSVLGLLPASARISGRIDFDGTDLASLSEKEFCRIRGRRIGLVPQDPGASLDPVRTIGSQVAEVFRLHRDGRRRSRLELRAEVVRLLTLVGIDRPEERLRQYPHELSGGLKQRVLIAIAFSLQPQVLIADEPTSALDVTVQRTVLEVFDRLAKEFGTAVIFVTHDLAVATDHADRIVVMRGGSVREDRGVEQVLARPEDEYTVRLLEEAAPARAAAPAAAASAAGTFALEAQGLVKVFDRGAANRAVDAVSFGVRQGTTFSLVGESGSGKSTTARMLMRLLDPTEGTVLVEGRDVTGLDGRGKRELWRTLQLVYQNPDSALDPRLRIRDIIAEPIVNFGLSGRAGQRERVLELLEQVNLPARAASARPMELSGGQRQRVAIARALAAGARTLVLDEALSALDVLTQAQILALLEELQRELGLTYLFISHDLHVVERISHEVGVMRRGKLVETGPTAGIFGNPQHEYTRLLLDSNPGHRLRSLAASNK
ncbi:ABC transporter ATP-binding protein [Arthrobacter mangrovi]|uniref:ABC transporter ATP-binding protein n=1 Tax=Arthrobacter mangrovi TaxID=2966350 RepID=A0ABQ5MVN1_9MICC|nr:ABC transporter ATP-binding protein [Arthrobacter mangrovi]GLB68028.1 ABC transporter ATP-binding protein [Arthrobacter mangrovi]